MTARSPENPRVAAVRAISDVLDAGVSLSETRSFSTLKDTRDAAMAQHLAYAVLRWLTALQWLAGELLAKPLKRRDRDIGYLLLVGLQQLWHDRTASHAAVNEAAECARLLGKTWAVPLVNAVLRRFQREQAVLLERLQQQEARFAHPRWLLEELRGDWPREWQDIVSANNLQAPLWLRLNRRRTNRETFAGALREAGFETGFHPFAGDAVSVSPAVAVERIPGFREGWFSVQDPAAQLARDLVDPQPGERVLDACAAPGGKAAHLLESCPQIVLTMLDRQPRRLDQVRQNLRRLGLEAKAVAADAADTGSWWNGEKFDKILLDAPCSASGVIRRHPDIKWLRSPPQVDAVTVLQAELLGALWPLLRTNGVLVYATCSILKRENCRQIQNFRDTHADARAGEIRGSWGQPSQGGRQIMPGEAQMDGFFYAVLRKISKP